MSRYILLSFDVEEFDLPLEYNQPINLDEQLTIGQNGVQAILPILNDKSIATTLFTTANYAMHNANEIKQLSTQHEIASHTFYHTTFIDEHLLQSRLKLEEITGKPVTGLRMPRMRKVEMSEVKKAGYQYDSSINPTFLPGKYNNLHLPRNPYFDETVLRLPTSVTPNFRIPLFWLAFKNMPFAFYKTLAVQTLKKDGYICLYFHPWEFTNLSNYQLPGFVKRYAGNGLVERLEQLIFSLKKEGEFITIQNFLQQKSLT